MEIVSDRVTLFNSQQVGIESVKGSWFQRFLKVLKFLPPYSWVNFGGIWDYPFQGFPWLRKVGGVKFGFPNSF